MDKQPDLWRILAATVRIEQPAELRERVRRLATGLSAADLQASQVRLREIAELIAESQLDIEVVLHFSDGGEVSVAAPSAVGRNFGVSQARTAVIEAAASRALAVDPECDVWLDGTPSDASAMVVQADQPGNAHDIVKQANARSAESVAQIAVRLGVSGLLPDRLVLLALSPATLSGTVACPVIDGVQVRWLQFGRRLLLVPDAPPQIGTETPNEHPGEDPSISLVTQPIDVLRRRFDRPVLGRPAWFERRGPADSLPVARLEPASERRSANRQLAPERRRTRIEAPSSEPGPNGAGGDAVADAVLAEFDRLRARAASGNPEQLATLAERLDARAWKLIDDAAPVRLSYVARLFSVPEQTLGPWVGRGVLDCVEGRPQWVTFSSVVEVREIVQQLREHAEDPGAVRAATALIDGEARYGRSRLQASVAQMLAGERGTLPY